MARVFKYRGKTAEELAQLDIPVLTKLLPSKIKRSMTRGLTEPEKKLLKKINAAKEGKYKKLVKTHCKDMPVLPVMFGMKIGVHNGKEFLQVQIAPEMLGHRLGDFVETCKPVKHSGPGIGATRGSKFLSVK